MLPYIKLTPTFLIPTYFFLFAVIYSLCVVWIFERLKRVELNKTHAFDFALIVMIGGFIGSRLFHVIIENPDYYWEQPTEILKFWHGGFVFYGGAVGALLPALWYAKVHQLSILAWLDFFSPVIALGYSLGRGATFLSGSGYGKPTDLWWSVTFPAGVEAPAGIPLHPTQLYAMFWECWVLFILLMLEKRLGLSHSGKIFFSFITLHSIGRAIVEQFRDDFRGPLIFGVSFSTFVSLLVLVIGLSGITLLKLKNKFRT